MHTPNAAGDRYTRSPRTPCRQGAPRWLSRVTLMEFADAAAAIAQDRHRLRRRGPGTEVVWRVPSCPRAAKVSAAIGFCPWAAIGDCSMTAN